MSAADGVSLDAVLHAARGNRRGTVVQAHGITADMDEGGMFVRRPTVWQLRDSPCSGSPFAATAKAPEASGA